MQYVSSMSDFVKVLFLLPPAVVIIGSSVGMDTISGRRFGLGSDFWRFTILRRLSVPSSK
jgi:hypothetical protein